MQNNAAFLASEKPTPTTAIWLVPPPDRDELVQQGLPLVKAIAERLRRRYTLTASFEDLCAMGMTGLAVAVDRFDATRGASFVTRPQGLEDRNAFAAEVVCRRRQLSRGTPISTQM